MTRTLVARSMTVPPRRIPLAVRHWLGSAVGILGCATAEGTASHAPVVVIPRQPALTATPPAVESCEGGPCLRATDVTIGRTFACARLDDGRVACWGRDRTRERGFDPFLRPHVLDGLRDIAQVSAGQHSACAVDRSGSVFCWGQGYDHVHRERQLTSYRLTEIAGVTDAVAIAVGPERNCARLRSDRVTCWDDPNPLPFDATLTTHRELEWRGTTALVGGSGDMVCGLDAAGTFTCAQRFSERRWALGAATSAIAMGSDFACAITDGVVRCFALPITKESPPLPVTLPGQAKSVAVGIWGHACAALEDGTVYCWVQEYAADPAQAPMRRDVGFRTKLVRMGYLHACAVGERGEVACWGPNDSGEVGDGTLEARPQPRTILPRLGAIPPPR